MVSNSKIVCKHQVKDILTFTGQGQRVYSSNSNTDAGVMRLMR